MHFLAPGLFLAEPKMQKGGNCSRIWSNKSMDGGLCEEFFGQGSLQSVATDMVLLAGQMHPIR